MTTAAVKAGITRSVLTAIVAEDGKVKISGEIKPKDENPIIMVGYQNNRNPNFHEDADYAYNVVSTLQKQYGFKEMNLVGHSMGNMSIMYMLLDYGNRKNFPTLEKQVDIAGHFDGIIGYHDSSTAGIEPNGRPKDMTSYYKDLLKLRTTYPKTAEVINIYGNLQDGTNSDGRVRNDSSKSLKYLVPRAKSYQEYQINGKAGQHSQLHEDKQVDKIIIKFLWNK